MEFERNLKIRSDFDISILDMKESDPESLFQLAPGTTCVFFVSSYTDGAPPPGCEFYCDFFKEATNDYRVSKQEMAHLYYVVVGLGDSAYPTKFYNKPAIQLDDNLTHLGAFQLMKPQLIDYSTEARTESKIAIELLTAILQSTFYTVEKNATKDVPITANGNGAVKNDKCGTEACECKADAANSIESSEDEDINYESSEPEEDSGENCGEPVVDVEDVIPTDGVRNRKAKLVPRSRKNKPQVME